MGQEPASGWQSWVGQETRALQPLQSDLLSSSARDSLCKLAQVTLGLGIFL